LTLNPLKHLDRTGTLAIMLFGFGWAKTVPVNPSAFRNPKRGMAIIAAAGPIANILFSLVLLIALKLFIVYMPLEWLQSNIVDWVINITDYTIFVSISLAIFNLLPMAPLDGSKVLGMFLSDNLYYKMLAYEKYITVVVYVLIFFRFLSKPINILNEIVFNLLDKLTFFIPPYFNFYIS
jgi:Zn-dependent protease